ncbi:ferredoxin [Brachybacterium sp. ACRRE]|uniref:ferredoxin n=1 Tax=Brachybacterium sp. ACRRE TaxID=2918184 RepID=UPI001EF37080|nr:ferredoxin [Brachybacterium sp. ACRRE]MCG7308955.1 ferredoxin [Brachybacterium sp. ACRRE]
MKIEIDQLKCVGAGQCVMAAEDVFDQRDEDGIVVLLEAEPDDSHAPDVRTAAALCPAAAITVHE